MAVSIAAGSFLCPTATGVATVVTGLSFEPKLLFLMQQGNAADAFGAGARLGFGATTATDDFAVYSVAQDNALNTNKHHRHVSNRCSTVVSNSGSLFTEFQLSAFNSDGFDIDVNTANASARRHRYLAIGGTDFQCHIKQIQSPAATGNQSYTGVGFQPDAIIVATVAYTTVPSSTNTNGGQRLGLGYATGASAISAGIYSSTSADANRWMKGVQIISVPGAAASELLSASLVSMDSDGYTFNWANVVNGAYCWVISLKGGQYKVGTDTTKTSTGTKATTGVGFQPIGLMLLSTGDTTSTVNTDARLSAGFAASTTERTAGWTGETDNQATSIADSSDQNDQILTIATEGTPTLVTEADLSSLDSDGFTLNYGTAGATAYDIGYLAIGNVAGGEDGTKFPWTTLLNQGAMPPSIGHYGVVGY